jgi:predicted metalloprotease with PDZ domain
VRLLFVVVLSAQTSAPQLYYSLTVPNDRSAFLIELQINNPPNPSRVVIPYWAPGAYRPANSGANIRDFAAVDGAGNPLPVRQDSPISWVIDTKGNPRITVRYATGLSDTIAWRRPNNRWYLRAASGLVDGPRTFMYLDGWKQAPVRLTFQLPAGWHAATGLPPTSVDSTIYVATNYDVLIDSPILLGHYWSYPFTAAGTPHRAVVDVAGVRMRAPGTLVNMLRRISTTAIGIFGSAPYANYTYIFVGGRGGGLEHLNSTTIGVTPETLIRSPLGATTVSAHEFFHVWNVKRIRPVELGPFDYEHDVRTVNLWWSEGVTDYYAELILARAGLNMPADFARHLGTSIENYQANPAHLTISPERASWTVWDPPAVNEDRTISYYLQGELLGFLLDLAIRDSTDNAKSLDDVMRYLMAHNSAARGFTRDDLVAALRGATGKNFDEFWRLYVTGATEIPWNDFLKAAGWRVAFSEMPAVDARIASIPPSVQGGRWRAVATPGSAAAAAGLQTGDELVRINRRDIIDGTDVTAAVQSIRRGAPVVVEVVRDSQPLTVRFRAGTYRRVRAQLRDLLIRTPRMRRIRAGLLK